MSKATQKGNSEALFKAASKGDISKLKTIIALEPKVDVRDASGKTPLMRAAECGHLEAVKLLRALGADVRAVVQNRDSIWRGCNALIFAVQGGNAEVVELLLKAGASPNCSSTDGNSPLSFAVENQSPRMVDALLKAGARPNDAILVASVWEESTDVAVLLIAARANPNACDDLKQSVLHRSAEKGCLEIVRALIRAKANLNHKANGSTPLLIAIQNKRTECALELINAGADLSVTGMLRRTALMVAAVSNQVDIVRALVKAGAGLDAKDKEGRTALMLANEKEHTAVVEALRGKSHDESGYNVQEYLRAAKNGDAKRVREFLEMGIEVNVAYANGAKALTLAIGSGCTEVVQLLLEWGASASTTATAKLFGTAFRTDVLALAAGEGHLEIVRLLLKAGANVKKSRMFGDGVLEAPARKGHIDVMRELIKAGCPIKGRDAMDALESTIHKKNEAAALVLVEAGVKPRGITGANFLVSAVENKMVRLVKALLAAGVDPKQRNEYDELPLQAARVRSHKAILALLEKAHSPQASPGMEFVEAAEQGDLKVIHRLILEGVDLETRDAKGATALIRAASRGHLAVMKALIAIGANPNATTHFAKRDSERMFHHMELTSETPLSCAVAARCLPAVELLVKAGADMRKTECGHLACMILQEGEQAGADFVSRLVDLGMDPNSTWPVINVSALEIAAQEGFTALVERLVNAGARLRSPVDRDRAVLCAVQRGRWEIVRLLIERGTSPKIKAVVSCSSLITAAVDGRDEIVRVLLQHGVRIDGKTKAFFKGEGTVEGVTALMAAARHGHISTVKILLDADANPNTEDATRRTALDWATDNKSKNVASNICRLLKAAGAKE